MCSPGLIHFGERFPRDLLRKKWFAAAFSGRFPFPSESLRPSATFHTSPKLFQNFCASFVTNGRERMAAPHCAASLPCPAAAHLLRFAPRLFGRCSFPRKSRRSPKAREPPSKTVCGRGWESGALREHPHTLHDPLPLRTFLSPSKETVEFRKAMRPQRGLAPSDMQQRIAIDPRPS